MKALFLTMGIVSTLSLSSLINAHCQMPCGIYHDDMVYDQIDQYTETMYKGVSVLNDSKFATVKDRNEFVRWVMEKESASDEVASILTKYFLQQKIKPGEPDTTKRIVAVHKLLFLLVAIKQNASLEFVKEFTKEWDQFKLMFHQEGYECLVEEMKLKKEAAKRMEEEGHSHDHDHDHDHEHGEHTHTH